MHKVGSSKKEYANDIVSLPLLIIVSFLFSFGKTFSISLLKFLTATASSFTRRLYFWKYYLVESGSKIRAIVGFLCHTEARTFCIIFFSCHLVWQIGRAAVSVILGMQSPVDQPNRAETPTEAHVPPRHATQGGLRKTNIFLPQGRPHRRVKVNHATQAAAWGP